jgi:hypothetical protein
MTNSKSGTNRPSGTYTYTRQMRDGTVKEITALLNQSKRKRTGKTAKDKANVKRTKVA